MQVTVRDLMTATPVTMPPTATISQAAQMINRECVSEIYLINAAGHLVGVVPDYEVFKSLLLNMPSDECVGTLMSANPLTLEANDDVFEVATLFRDRRCSRVAVLDDNRLVGQIGRRDILRLMMTMQAIDEPLESTKADNSGLHEPIPEPQFMKQRQVTKINAER